MSEEEFESDMEYRTILCNYGDFLCADYRTFTLSPELVHRRRCLELLADNETMRSFIRKYHSNDPYPEFPGTVPDLDFEASLLYLNEHLRFVPMDKDICSSINMNGTSESEQLAQAYTSIYDKATGAKVKKGSETWGKKPPKFLESLSSDPLMGGISYSQKRTLSIDPKSSSETDAKKSAVELKKGDVKNPTAASDAKKPTTAETKKVYSKKAAIGSDAKKTLKSSSLSKLSGSTTTEEKKSTAHIEKSSKPTAKVATAKTSSSEGSVKKSRLSSSSSSSVTDSDGTKSKAVKSAKKSSKSSSKAPSVPSYFDDIDTVYDIPLLDVTNQSAPGKTDDVTPSSVVRKPAPPKDFALSVERMMQEKLAKLGVAPTKEAAPVSVTPPKVEKNDNGEDSSKDESKVTESSKGRVTARSKFKTCENCGIEIVDRIQVCSSCKKVAYCNYRCQKTHWKVHKKACSYTKKNGQDRTG